MATFNRAAWGCLFFVLVLVFPTWATHILGGELTYSSDTTASPNLLRYFFKLVTYHDGNSSADNPEATLGLGDGIRYTSPRVSKMQISNSCGKVFASTYYFEHTFAGPGQYTAVYTEVNRWKGIVNIAHAEEQAFTISAKISVDVFDGANTSHRSLLPPIFCANLNQPFRHSLAAYDLDGDSLVYELVTPLTATDGSGSFRNVTGYNLPNQVSLNARTGEFVWPKPDRLGAYTFAIRVSQYRNQRFTGSYIRDFNVNVVAPEEFTQSFTIENRAQLPINDQNQITLTVGQPLEIKVKYQTNGTAKGLAAYSDLFYKTQDYTLDTTSAAGTITAVFKITPEESWRRNQPYILIFRSTSFMNETFAQQDFTITILTKPETISGTYPDLPGKPATEPTSLFTVFPNPAPKSFRVINQQQLSHTRLFLYNIQSQLILEQALSPNESVIRLPYQASGLYIYQIRSADNQIRHIGRLQIE